MQLSITALRLQICQLGLVNVVLLPIPASKEQVGRTQLPACSCGEDSTFSMLLGIVEIGATIEAITGS